MERLEEDMDGKWKAKEERLTCVHQDTEGNLGMTNREVVLCILVVNCSLAVWACEVFTLRYMLILTAMTTHRRTAYYVICHASTAGAMTSDPEEPSSSADWLTSHVLSGNAVGSFSNEVIHTISYGI